MFGAYVPRGQYYPKASKPDKKSLSEELTRAINMHDTVIAREVFDRAFWSKIDLVPDWRQLLAAVLYRDQQMVRLLGTHGACWTTEEARGLKEIFPEDWAHFTLTLHNNGISTDFGDLTVEADIVTRATMARQLLENTKDGFSNNALKEKADALLSDAVIHCLKKSDVAEAVTLLRLRQPQGALDIDRDVEKIIKSEKSVEKKNDLLYMFSCLHAELKPVRIDMDYAARTAPWCIPALDRWSLLEAPHPGRLLMASEMLKAPAKQLGDYQIAVSDLFSHHPASTEEVETFIAVYRLIDNKNIEENNAHLHKSRFFDSPAWTPERLLQLADMMAENASLRKTFNSQIARNRFESLPAKDIVKNPQVFADFVEAHKKGWYVSGYNQIYELMFAIQDKYKKGDVPDTVRDGLQIMKDAGARFDDVSHNLVEDYLGKKEPGLAKILLDMDVLRASSFDLGILADKAKIKISANSYESKVTFDERKHTGKYAEFFCQICLEQMEPKTYIPLRRKIPSYAAKMKAHFPVAPKQTVVWR